MSWRRAWPGVAVAALALAGGPAGAAVLVVGPGEAFAAPSQAARAAQDGDRIEIRPGEYFDCAVWPQSAIVITGPVDPKTPAVLSYAACQGKALFVVSGRDVTVRHLTFTRVRVPDGNGAGIRAEGHGLVVSHSRFVNNQAGIVAADQPGATLVVADSRFERNGAALGERCVATLQVGAAALLRIERSVFAGARACDLVRGWAAQTEIVDSWFADGDSATVPRMVAVSGGALLVQGGLFARGAGATDAAIEMRDLWREASVEVRGVQLENGSGRSQVLVRMLARGPVRLEGNRIGPGDTELDSSGLWAARARDLGRSAVATARWAAGKVVRAVRSVLPF